MRRRAFTVVELLAVTGIISVVFGMLLPALTRARAAGQQVVCQNNIRQLVIGLSEYAAQYKSFLPPNTNSPAKWWTDYDRIGRILTPNSKSDLQGPAITCPVDDGSIRSYAMNVWASSAIDNSVTAANPITGLKSGTPWSLRTRFSTKLMLITETWASSGTAATGFFTPATVGTRGDTPGHRFGGGSGTSFIAGRFGKVLSELNYSRHRLNRGPGSGNAPIGRVNIGFADGHVEQELSSELYDSASLSTLQCLWTPMDFDNNR